MRRRISGSAVAGIVLAVSAAAVATVLVIVWAGAPGAGAHGDAAVPTVGAAPGGSSAMDGTAGGVRTVQPPLPGQPLTLSVPSVGLTTSVRTLARPTSGTIDPPTSTVAYWISAYGQAGPSSDNTVYIAGHTCHGRCHAVFSPFMDIPDSATTVHPGDPISVATPTGTWNYTVTGTELWDKGGLGDDATLWQTVPGRLVLITCFQYEGGTSSQQNFIVYAQLDPGQS